MLTIKVMADSITSTGSTGTNNTQDYSDSTEETGSTSQDTGSTDGADTTGAADETQDIQASDSSEDTPPASSGDDGQADMGDDDFSSGESTVYHADDYDSESPQTTSTTDAVDTTGEETVEDRTAWFDKLLADAKNGDKAAQQRLLQMSNPLPVQDTEILQDAMNSQDGYNEEGEEDPASDLYTKALDQQALLDALAKKATLGARQFPKDSALAKALLAQSQSYKGASKSLSQDMKALQARRQDVLAALNNKKYQQLLSQKDSGKSLSPDQEAQLARYNDKYPAFTAGRAALHNSQKVHAAEVKTQEVELEPMEASPEEQAAKEQEEVAQEKVGALADATTEEHVQLAETAVMAHVPEDIRKERLRVYREKQEAIKVFRQKMKEANNELSQATGENAGMAGAAFLVGGQTKKGSGQYRLLHERGHQDLLEGKSSSCGLVFFDGEVARAAYAGENGTVGVHTAASFSGSREDVEKGMVKYNPVSTGFNTNLPIMEKGETPEVYGVMRFFKPWADRAHTTAAMLQRRGREIGMGR